MNITIHIGLISTIKVEIKSCLLMNINHDKESLETKIVYF